MASTPTAPAQSDALRAGVHRQVGAVVDGSEMPHGLRGLVPRVVAVPKADASFLCVAAASILAKVARDRAMVVAHALHPEWHFDEHKGYATAQHRALIAKARGVLTPYHRRSFATVH
jgi:ribonuclease HII